MCKICQSIEFLPPCSTLWKPIDLTQRELYSKIECHFGVKPSRSFLITSYLDTALIFSHQVSLFVVWSHDCLKSVFSGPRDGTEDPICSESLRQLSEKFIKTLVLKAIINTSYTVIFTTVSGFDSRSVGAMHKLLLKFYYTYTCSTCLISCLW